MVWHSQLADAIGEDAMLTGITMDEAVNADLNTGATCKVFQGIDPVEVDLGNPDPHVLV